MHDFASWLVVGASAAVLVFVGAAVGVLVLDWDPFRRLAHRPDGSSYLEACLGREVVAHVGDVALMGRIDHVVRDEAGREAGVVLGEVRSVVDDGVGRPPLRQRVDGEVFVSSASSWLQVLP